MRHRSGLGALALACVVACGGADFVVHVTFEEEVEIERGAAVTYQGVPIGEVSGVSVTQAAPNQPGYVTLTLAIDADGVTLRENDLFEYVEAGLMGEASVEITPSPEVAEPLVSGSTVRGVPPLVTRIGESIEELVEDLGAVATEKTREALDALARSLEGVEFEALDGVPDESAPDEEDSTAPLP